MISKIAKVHAMREAFPRDLGGLYVEDELLPSNNDQGARQPLPEAQVDDKQREMGSGKAASFFGKQTPSSEGDLFNQNQ